MTPPTPQIEKNGIFIAKPYNHNMEINIGSLPQKSGGLAALKTSWTTVNAVSTLTLTVQFSDGEWPVEMGRPVCRYIVYPDRVLKSPGSNTLLSLRYFSFTTALMGVGFRCSSSKHL